MNTSDHEGPVFVSSEAAQAVFDWQQSIAAIQVAYGAPLDHTALPRRSVANGAGAWLRTLPAIPATGRYFGAKLMGMATGASAPGVEYVIVLFDRETSRIAAFVDGMLVTGYRTAATSAAALDLRRVRSVLTRRARERSRGGNARARDRERSAARASGGVQPDTSASGSVRGDDLR